MHILTREKIGKILSFVPITVLGVFALFFLITMQLPTKKMSFLIFAVTIFIYILCSLLKGEIGVRGYHTTIERSKEPRVFWIAVVFYSLITVAAFLLAVFESS